MTTNTQYMAFFNSSNCHFWHNKCHHYITISMAISPIQLGNKRLQLPPNDYKQATKDYSYQSCPKYYLTNLHILEAQNRTPTDYSYPKRLWLGHKRLLLRQKTIVSSGGRGSSTARGRPEGEGAARRIGVDRADQKWKNQTRTTGVVHSCAHVNVMHACMPIDGDVSRLPGSQKLMIGLTETRVLAGRLCPSCSSLRSLPGFDTICVKTVIRSMLQFSKDRSGVRPKRKRCH